LFQIRHGPAHRLDRHREIFGHVVARDGQFHLPSFIGSPAVERKQEGTDLVEGGDAPEDQELVVRSREGLKRDIAEFPRESGIVLRELLNPCPGVACKHRLLDDGFDRLLLLAARDKEEIPRQHQIDDLPPTVRTDCASPNRAGDNIIPIVCET